MRSKPSTISGILLMLLSTMILVMCGKQTEEDAIFGMMDEVKKYVEHKDVGKLIVYIADDYMDFQGRDKNRTEDMISQYFQDFHGIVTHVLSTKIDEIMPLEASVRADVLLSSGGAKLFRELVKYAGDYYRIKARLVKSEGQWKLQYTEWSFIRLEDLLPESVSVLKKIFPNL